MRTISDNFRNAILSKSLEPIFVAKIINSDRTIYLTSRNVVIDDAGSTQLQGVIELANFSSQNITPEDGISTIGGMPIKLLDSSREFTTLLSELEALDLSLYNNKVELYYGYANIDFADYLLWIPLYVDSFSNDEISYTLKLTDTQRISKKSLFSGLSSTELVGSYGYNSVGTIEVLSGSYFPLVEHDADWSEDPGETIGYVKINGITADGRETKEVISYTGTTATTLTGCRRGRFGTERVDLSATDSDGNDVTVELIEMVYLDLVQPKMLIALLTGDLYGQVGQTIPEAWSAGLDLSLLSLSSIENVGGDLWQEHIEFRDLADDDAKGFIADQVLAPYGTYLRVDQYGQYALARYDFLSQLSAADVVLGYPQLEKVTPTTRSVSDIVNYFRINWEWRLDGEYYARNDYYIDENSQSKYGYESPIKDINLLGLRNRDSNSKVSLDFVAQSQVKRLSNPSLNRTVTAYLRHVADLEVGDKVTLSLDNEPYYKTNGSYLETFEVQSMKVDFMAGLATLSLFASEGVPSEFVVDNGDSVASISTAGRTNLDGSPYGTVSGGVFQFNVAANLPSGKYYFDGDVEVPSNRTIFGNGTIYLDCANFYMASDTKFNLKGRGPISDGYFGGQGTAQGRLRTNDPNGLFSKGDQIWFEAIQSNYSGDVTSVNLPDIIRVENGENIDSLIPSALYGAGGGKGADGDIDDVGATPPLQAAGGAAVAGGGGLFISCDAMQYESSSVIDVSGSDNNVGSSTTKTSGDIIQYFNAGVSGFGWPGCVVVGIKDRTAAKPLLWDIVVAKTGAWDRAPLQGNNADDDQRERVITHPRSESRDLKISTYSDYYPAYPSGVEFREYDFASSSNRSAIQVISLVVAGDYVPDVAIDNVASADAVTLNLVEYLNTPETPLGNQSTIEVTATPDPADDAFRYVLFEYRLLGQAQWVPISYDVRTEATFTVTSTGDTYEVRATSYNAANKSGGSVIEEFTTSIVNFATDQTNTDDAAVTLPNITGLELTNRIDDGDNWNQWKSPNAEFQWRKMSNTFAANVGNLNGSVDLHLEGYKVRITDLDGNVVREDQVEDTFYTYTYDNNKADNPEPIRDFTFEVQAVATTGYASEYTGFEVNNPAPTAPQNVVSSAGFTSIEVVFALPTDVDFVGVDAYIMEGVGDPYTEGELKRVSGNSIVWDGLTAGATYTIGLRSVDQFGDGGQITATGIQTNLIQSSALGNITTPVVIDEVGGRLITNNSGFIAFMGATDVPAESSNPLIFGAFNGADYPFWTDAAGDFKFGLGESAVSFNGSSLKVGRDAVLSGTNSYGNDFIYYYIRGYNDLIPRLSYSDNISLATGSDEATIFTQTSTIVLPKSNAMRATFVNSEYQFGAVDFDNEIRLKMLGQFASTSNGGEFNVGFGDVLSSNGTSQTSAVFIRFCNTSNGVADARLVIRQPTSTGLVPYDGSTTIDHYSSYYTDSHSVALSNNIQLEIAFIPSDSLRVFINGALVSQLSITTDLDESVSDPNINYLSVADFENISPINQTVGPTFFDIPYLCVGIPDTGSFSFQIRVGDIKFMNGPA